MGKHIIVKLNNKILENLFENLINEEKIYFSYLGKWFLYMALINDYCYYIKNNKKCFVLMNKDADIDFGSCEGEYLCRIDDETMIIDIDNNLSLFLKIDEETFKKYSDDNDKVSERKDEKYKGEYLEKPFVTSMDYRGSFFPKAKVKAGLAQIGSYSYIKFIKEFLSCKRNGFVEIKSGCRTIYLKNLEAESRYTLNAQRFYTEDDTNILDVFMEDEESIYDFISYYSNEDGQENISIKINDSLYVHYQNSNKDMYEYILDYKKIQDEISEQYNEIESNYWSGLSKEERENWDNMLED